MLGIQEGEYMEAPIYEFVGIQLGVAIDTSVVCSISTGELLSTWLLLDNKSMIDVITNPRMVTNIRTREKTMNIQNNTGTANTNLFANFEGVTVWHHPDGMANIISFYSMKKA